MAFDAVAFLQFSAVAPGVNDDQDKENCASDEQNNDDRLVPPQVAHETGEIGTHCVSIYTTRRKRQKKHAKDIC
jgi:hypothetical protein